MSPYEIAGYDKDGEDVSLIRWMLSMTPAERLDVLQSFVDELEEIREYRASHPVPQGPASVAQPRG
jgi:hypothetical protein